MPTIATGTICVNTQVLNIEARLIMEGDIALTHTLTGPLGTVDSFVCGSAELVGDDVVIFDNLGVEQFFTSRTNIITVVRTTVRHDMTDD